MTKNQAIAAPAVYIDVVLPGVGRVPVEPGYARVLVEHVSAALAAIETPSQEPVESPDQDTSQVGAQPGAETEEGA